MRSASASRPRLLRGDSRRKSFGGRLCELHEKYRLTRRLLYHKLKLSIGRARPPGAESAIDCEAFRAVDIPEDKALKAAAALGKRDVASLKTDTSILKWMMGFVLAFHGAIFARLFLH
jgi:hypothetical protein